MATTLDAKVNGTSNTGVMSFIGVSQALGGSGSTSPSTQIAAGMAETMVTNANGIPLLWASGYVVTPFVLAGLINFSFNAIEDVAATNISLRAKVGKLPARQAGGYTHVGTFDYGSELGTSSGDRTWSGTPSTPVPFERNSRIVLFLFYRAFGTPAAGVGTIQNDTQNGMTLTEDVTFSATLLRDPPIATLGRLARRDFI